MARRQGRADTPCDWLPRTLEEYSDLDKIRIQFTLFSAFYSPLISAMSGGFLKAEGLDPEWSVSPPGVSALEALRNGSAHVVQSALSQGFVTLDKGETPFAVHFAQVNEMDGFFLTGRQADPGFSWKKLEGAEVVTFKGGQPHAMFKYACHKAGIDYSKIKLITPGGPAEIDKAFRAGQGQYVHQQGPFPQQLQADGVGHIVAQVGKLIGPCGFSSLAATREWLKTDMAKAFMRAYRKTRAYMTAAPGRRDRQGGEAVLPQYRRKGARRLHRDVPEARLLDAARGDHARGLREDAGYLRVQRPAEAALSLRAGLRDAAGERENARGMIPAGTRASASSRRCESGGLATRSVSGMKQIEDANRFGEQRVVASRSFPGAFEHGLEALGIRQPGCLLHRESARRRRWRRAADRRPGRSSTEELRR